VRLQEEEEEEEEELLNGLFHIQNKMQLYWLYVVAAAALNESVLRKPY
jgi:hypothetical protein